MPFGLINAREKFQRAMDVDFRGLFNISVVVYLDDVTVYSKNIQYHIQNLTRIFERCRKYGISLNPKKTIFGVEEGKLLGHIIYQVGIRIDLMNKENSSTSLTPQQKGDAILLWEN
jgi:hypothetical protein